MAVGEQVGTALGGRRRIQGRTSLHQRRALITCGCGYWFIRHVLILTVCMKVERTSRESLNQLEKWNQVFVLGLNKHTQTHTLMHTLFGPQTRAFYFGLLNLRTIPIKIKVYVYVSRAFVFKCLYSWVLSPVCAKSPQIPNATLNHGHFSSPPFITVHFLLSLPCLPVTAALFKRTSLHFKRQWLPLPIFQDSQTDVHVLSCQLPKYCIYPLAFTRTAPSTNSSTTSSCCENNILCIRQQPTQSYSLGKTYGVFYPGDPYTKCVYVCVSCMLPPVRSSLLNIHLNKVLVFSCTYHTTCFSVSSMDQYTLCK